MAGLYIHIPFCKSRCIYCGFYSTTDIQLRQRYVDAVCEELRMRPSSDVVSTIYLGGGTPSQLTITQLHQLFETIYIYNKVEKGAEITIEMNPDDVTAEYAAALQELGVNRVSMGAQTFSNNRLHFLHRRHHAEQVTLAVKTLRQAGIQNISVDLMYGFPDELMSDWEEDVCKALELDVEHLSAYCLMIEENTPLYRMHPEPIDEELERQMYELLIDKLTAAGYEHYEISNFAKPGFRSRHNSSYWDGTPYIGIGAAAHSYDVKSRSWNVADIHNYIKGIEEGQRQFEDERIDENTRYNDAITVALRTKDGLDLDKLSEKHKQYCLANAQKFIKDGLLTDNHHRLRLTRKGLFVSDMIMSELIRID